MGEHDLDENHDMDPFAKGKKSIKRICCCGVVWMLIAIGSIVIGIALLVEFSQYLPSNEKKDKEAAGWIGVGFVLLAFVLLLISILFFVALKMMYDRYNKGANFVSSQFSPPFHAPGLAPYPQQPNDSPCYTGRIGGKLPESKSSGPPAYAPTDPLASNSSTAPSAPAAEKAPLKDGAYVEVDDATRF